VSLGLCCALFQGRLAPGLLAADGTAADPKLKWLGVASCASAACHHGNGPQGSAGSEYSTWVSYDPHARAYQALYNLPAKQIEKNLNKKLADVLDARPEENPLCIKCHGMSVSATQEGPRFARADGVGCESCHGPADRWLDRHYLRGPASGPEKQKALGMTVTKDLRIRAQVCTGCHVGDADREVNHDLIAAGHPRLNFEFGAYLANLPKHWQEKAPNTGADFEARVWAVGQVASLQAALKVLEARAKPAGRAAWPEFAEYDCIACHHGLRDEGWRRPRGPEKRPLGSYPWATWYQTLTPSLTRYIPGEGAAETRDGLAKLTKLMSLAAPNRERVLTQVHTTQRALDTWARSLDRQPWPAPRVQKLLTGLAADSDRLAGSGWDASAQLYQALVALYLARKATPPFPEKDVQVQCHLQCLYEKLRFKPGYGGPTGFKAEQLRSELGELQKLLRK
jgi:hypothetical protein